MTRTISQAIGNTQEMYQQMLEGYGRQLRVAEPGIIQSFNATEQTATVQLSIKERIQDPNTLEYSWMPIPLLVDVPVFFPRAGGFSITFPVQKGDECLVVFGDMCIDGWWHLGGTQTQPDMRRHDLSDGFAFVGFTSVPRALSNVSTTSLRIQTDDGSTYIQIKPGEIDLVGTTVKANGTVIG